MIKSQGMRTPKPGFGRLLEIYRHNNWMSQTELAEALNRRGFAISVSAINRYESGLRDPPLDFVVSASACLKLSPEQESALVMALFEDYSQKFWRDYKEALEKFK